MDGSGQTSWRQSLPAVLSEINNFKDPSTGISPNEALMGYTPRHVTDMLHDYSSIPECELRHTLEGHQQKLDSLREALLDHKQQRADALAERMDTRYTSPPPDWGKGDKTWYVYLKRSGFSDAELDKAGRRHRMNRPHAEGPFRVTSINKEDLNEFSIDLPDYMH